MLFDEPQMAELGACIGQASLISQPDRSWSTWDADSVKICTLRGTTGYFMWASSTLAIVKK